MTKGPEISRTTQIVMKDLADLRRRAAQVWEYDPALAISANLTNPTTLALEQKITAMEQGTQTIATGTGQAAIVTAILTAAVAGQNILLPDCVYGPVKLLAENQLKPLGIAAVYYDPTSLDDLRAKITPDTALIYLESPGSLTFEPQDIAAIAKVAREKGILTAMDNTWSTPLYCQPLTHGVDMVIHSLSKLAGGKSEVFGGSVTVVNHALYKRAKNMAAFLGHWLSPDDAAQIHSGLDTLPDRLAQQGKCAFALAQRLQLHPKIRAVFAPFLPDSQHHALWKKYHSGHCGLFSVALGDDIDDRHLDIFFKSLAHLSMSFGWGGPQSLIVPVRPGRSIHPAPKNMLRIYTGMADADTLAADIENALDRLPS